MSIDQLEQRADDHAEHYKLVTEVRERFRQLGQPKDSAAFDAMSQGDLYGLLDRLDAEIEQQESLPEKPPAEPTTGAPPKNKSPVRRGGTRFVMLPNDALMDPTLMHSSIRLLGVLIDLCGGKGFCWHSESLLGRQIVSPSKPKGLSVKQVQRALVELSAPGHEWIKIYSPEESERRGFDTTNPKTGKRAESNTIVLNIQRDR